MDTPTETSPPAESATDGNKTQDGSKSTRISLRWRFPRIHSTMLSKKKGGADLQEASQGWVKQNSQSSKCAVSQSSSE